MGHLLIFAVGPVGCALVVALATLGRGSAARQWLERNLTPLAAGVAALLLVSYAASLALVSLLPVVLDSAEMAVSSTAFLIVHGQPAYTALDAPLRYSLLYGPVCYLPYAAALALHPSLSALKLTVLLEQLALMLVLWAVFRRLLSPLPTLVALGFVAAVLNMKDLGALLIRGDAALLLAVAVVLLAASTRRAGLAVALFVLGGVCAVDTKFTAVFYLLVPGYLLWRRLGAMPALLAAVLTPVGALLVFLLPPFSLHNYLAWLHAAAHHPLSRHSMAANLLTAVLLSLAPALMLLRWWLADAAAAQRAVRQHLGLGAVALLSLAGSVVTGSKVGSGRSHLVCSFLIAGWLAAMIWRASPHRPGPRPPLLLAGYALYAAFLVVPSLGQSVDLYRICWLRRPFAQAVNRDLDQIAQAHPGQTIEIAYADAPDRLAPVDARSLFRSRLVLAGHPVSFEAGNLFDSGLSRLPLPAASADGLRACRPDVWLVPRDAAPFALRNAYVEDVPERFPDPAVFDRTFRAAFLTSYTKSGSSEFYDIWQCKRPRRP